MVERIVRPLLLAYPPATRARYGAEITQVIAERLRCCRRSRGRVAATRLLARESAALVVAGLRVRLHGVRPDPPRCRRDHRPRQGAGTMHLLLHDLGHAARGFLRRPAFTAVAVGALALGIGTNIAIFSVVHALLLRPLPFADPQRLVAVWEKNAERGWRQAQVAAANYLDWREEARSFDDMAAYNDWLEEATVMVEGEPVVVRANEVTGSFFRVLGVPPTLGVGFADEHSWAAAGRAAVLSYGLWQRLFGGDPEVVGRQIELSGVGHRILGVMPAGFDFPFRDAELWVNVAWDPERRQQMSFRRAHGMRVIGRLRQGVTRDQAAAELATIAARLAARYPETNNGMGNGLTPLREWIVGDTRQPLRILMAAVGLVLLIACANVANMLLARATRRRQEMAVRRAIGASRRRLVLQGLSEGMLLATAGGVLGLALGAGSIAPFLALSPKGLPRLTEVTVSGPVVLFSVGVTLLTGLVFGLLPAWRSANADATDGWTARGASPHRRSLRASNLLVVAEVALTLPLLVGSGLVTRTLWNLAQVAPGFDAEEVLVARVALPATRYPDGASIVGFYRELLASVRDLPGVQAAAMSSRLPFGNQRWSSDFAASGWPADRFGIGVRHDEITPGLFRTLEVPLVRGRDFAPTDTLETPAVVIINQALADRFFPGEDPLGQRVAFDRVPDEGSTWRTIVGVVGNVRRESLAREELPGFYAPVLQDPTRSLYLQVRTVGDPPRLVDALRQRVHDLDPALPLFDVTTLEEVTAASVARERFMLALLGAFAGIAMLLAAIGIFGVTHYATMRRVREIGVRVAVGAGLGSVVVMVVRRGISPVLAGIAAGLLLAAGLVRALSALLFEVQPLDLPTFAGAAALLLLAALVACVPPARWACRVDVVAALRAE